VPPGCTPVAIDDERIYMAGEEETIAYDLKTQKVSWRSPAAGSAPGSRPLLTSSHYYQLTWAGLCELDKQTGKVTRRFPDLDRDAPGETILMTDKLVLTVSPRAVTAYALDAHSAQP
jgi:hypothetical protein